jgi:GNAT superfamily N-acetyltransferase
METNNKIIIRTPLPGELGWIIQVHGQYYAKMFGWLDEFECIVSKIIVDYFNCEQHDRQACFIAELDGKPVGCIMLMSGREMEGKLRVMFVSEEARGNGIGRLLIQSVFEKAKSIGYKSISLWTTDKQRTARELYKKHGFSLISATPNETFAKGSNDELWKADL